MNEKLITNQVGRVTALVDLDHEQLASNVVKAIREGLANPLEVHVSIKRMEKLFKSVNEDESYKESLQNYVQSNLEGNSKSVKFHGHSIGIQAVHTSYDFSSCNDPLWNAWNDIRVQAEEALKLREESLKAGWPQNQFGIPRRDELIQEIPTIAMEFNEDIATINPPTKRQKTGVVVRFGKTPTLNTFENDINELEL